MKIGIIGTGAIGSIIARKLRDKGHEIRVNNTNEPLELEKKARDLGVIAATIEQLVKNADVIILSVPTVAIPTLSKSLFQNVSNDVIVVDTSNYYPFRDAEIEELKNGKVESVWVSEQLGRPVIKAFNNLLAESLANGGKETGTEDRIAMAVSGDDENSKKAVSGLISDMGFDAVDAGTLSESWRHQPGTPAYCTELNTEELKNALKAGVKDTAATYRDLVINTFMKRTTAPTHEEIVELNRSLFLLNPKNN